MKVIVFILLAVFVFIACDPVQLVYVKNYTDSEIQLNVEYQKHSVDNNNIGVQQDDTLIESPKLLLTYKFKQKLTPNFNSDTSYSIRLAAKSTSLLGPLTIGFPINKLNINGSLGQDSVLFYRRSENLKSQLRKGKLQKVNWAFFIYSYRN